MKYTRENFPEIVSVRSKWLTSLVAGFGRTFFIAVPLSALLLLIITFNAGNVPAGIKILIAVFALLLLYFFGRLLISMKKEKKHTITRVVVNNTGLHHYVNESPVKSITYEAMARNPENGIYDILLDDPGDTDRPYEICIFVYEAGMDKIRRKLVLLEAGFVIANGNLLKRHFLNGISVFRPDLKIAPNVLTHFRM